MGQPRVFVTRRLPEGVLDPLLAEAEVEVWAEEEPPPYEVLRQRARQVDGLLCLLTDRVDADLIESSSALRVISQMAVGVDNIDLQAATRQGIPVGHTPGVLTEATADFTWALLLAAARRVVEGDRYVREGRWRTWSPTLLLGPDVHGSTLGIVGFGRIGQAVARRAQGFGMKVLYHSRTRRPDLEGSLGAAYASLENLLRQSDLVTLHTPLTEETHHLIDEDALRLMKPSAVLVNVARGPVVDPQALFRALKEGWIAFAALDVTEPEPLPPDSPLLDLPNLIVTPHLASASLQARRRMGEMAVANLLAGLRGERLPHCANPEVYQQAGP